MMLPYPPIMAATSGPAKGNGTTPARPPGSLIRSLRIVVVALGVVVAALATALIIQVIQASRTLDRSAVQEDVVSLMGLQERRLLELAASQRLFILTEEERYLASVPAAVDGLRDGLSELERLSSLQHGDSPPTTEIRVLTERFLDGWALPLIAAARRDGEAAQRRLVTGEGERRLRAVLNALEAARVAESVERDRLEAEVDRHLRIGAALAVGSLLLVLAAFVFTADRFRRNVIVPVVGATDVAERIASGDARERVGLVGAGEVRRLGIALDAMADAADESHRALEARNVEISRERVVLRSVLAATPTVICLLDSSDRLVVSNRPQDEIPSAAFEDLDRAGGTSEIQDGAGRWFRRYIAPVGRVGDAGLGRIVVLDDITSERVADQAKADLISTVSHELRTPLAAVLGYAESLSRRSDDPDRVARYADVIQREAKRLSHLVGDLLDTQLIEHGRLELHRDAFDLAELVRGQADLFSMQGDAHVLLVRGADSAVIVDADHDRVGQVIGNLLSNAIKYSPDGTITVGLDVQGGRAVVSVSDEGIGLSEEDRRLVFERFYRADPGPLGPVRGTGLGLSLAREIVLAHGGTLSVESRLGEGSTFRFDLPLAPAATPPPAPHESVARI